MFSYLDVCAGISASTVAWKPMGWRAAAYSEIDPGPRAVLAHHYPDVPLHGDFTTIGAGDYGAIDLLIGGTPCQDFSVAGLRAGMDGARGNLSLEFLRLADRKRPRWIIWENVPGVLSNDGGRAFGAILGGMASIGYGFAYRVLDAQFFGLPQRRERVFVVGFLGDWRKAGAVLFERETFGSGRKPRYPKGEKALHTISTRVGQGSIDLFDEVNALARFGHPRRLHINEVERLFGFPDDYTLVPWRNGWMPERRRQKMLGNSISVPVIRWIGQRIAIADVLP